MAPPAGSPGSRHGRLSDGGSCSCDGRGSVDLGALIAASDLPLRIGVPFPFSMHAELLYYWLGAISVFNNAIQQARRKHGDILSLLKFSQHFLSEVFIAATGPFGLFSFCHNNLCNLRNTQMVSQFLQNALAKISSPPHEQMCFPI